MTRLSASGAAVGALLLSAASLASMAAFADPAPGATSAPNAATHAPAAITVTKPGDPASGVDWHARRHADHEAFFAARLASLHAGLQLKPDQDGLWAPVETAIRDLAKAHRHHHDHGDARAEDHDGKETAARDDLRTQSARLIQVGNAMKALADAADPLVASMTAEQKDRLPTLLEGLRPKHVLMRAFGLDGEREARDEGHGRRHWRREAERNDAGRHNEGRQDESRRDEGGDDDRHGFDHDFGHRDHGGWREGERDDHDGQSQWHHHHHHHDDEDGDEPTRS